MQEIKSDKEIGIFLLLVCKITIFKLLFIFSSYRKNFSVCNYDIVILIAADIIQIYDEGVVTSGKIIGKHFLDIIKGEIDNVYILLCGNKFLSPVTFDIYNVIRVNENLSSFA